jgi:hypothetical protein
MCSEFAQDIPNDYEMNDEPRCHDW